ncbi:MAG: hypothetical protein AB7N76_04780 [Planctomycetota bacterium]
MSEQDDPFAPLRGMQLPRPGAPLPPAPGELPGGPPLATPQPEAWSWPTLRRGLVRGGFDLVVALLSLGVLAWQIAAYVTWDWWLGAAARLAGGVALVAALALVERWLAERPAAPSGRAWLTLGLGLFLTRVIEFAWSGYLSIVVRTHSPAAAMTEIVQRLVLSPNFVSYAVIAAWTLPYLGLIALRLRGARLAPQIAAVAGLCVAADMGVMAILQAGYAPFLAPGACLRGALLGAGMVYAWHLGDRLSDRRWGRVPIARAEVRELAARAELDPPLD